MSDLQSARGMEKKQQRSKTRQYVINMHGNKKKLHVKDGCYWSKIGFIQYLDFDSLAEAKNCGVESTVCEICFNRKH